MLLSVGSAVRRDPMLLLFRFTVDVHTGLTTKLWLSCVVFVGSVWTLISKTWTFIGNWIPRGCSVLTPCLVSISDLCDWAMEACYCHFLAMIMPIRTESLTCVILIPLSGSEVLTPLSVSFLVDTEHSRISYVNVNRKWRRRVMSRDTMGRPVFPSHTSVLLLFKWDRHFKFHNYILNFLR